MRALASTIGGRIISIVAACLFTAAAAATTPNINGALFSTSGNTTRFNCTNPGDNGVFPFNSDTRITRQNGASFTATETVMGVQFVGVYSGSIAPAGDVAGSSSATASGRSASGAFSGSIDILGGNLNLQNQGKVEFDNGDTCDFVSNVLGNLVSGPVASGTIIDPSLLSSIELVTPFNLQSEIRPFTNGLGARVNDVLAGLRTTARVDGSRLYAGAETGLAAGDLSSLGAVGVWGSISRTASENDFAALAFDGSRYNVVAGVDASPSDRVVAGIAFGWETADYDTTFNSGNIETDGFTAAPYIGMLIDDTWSVDGSFGYSVLDSDQFRRDPATGAVITSAPDSKRWFGQLNVNGTTYHGNWTIGGRLGLLWAKSQQDRFVESDATVVPASSTKLGELSIGGDVAYQLDAASHGVFEPFAGLSYQYDWSMTDIRLATGPQPSNDDDDVLVRAGVRYFGDNGLTGNLEWSKRLGRADYDEDVFNLTLRMDF